MALENWLEIGKLIKHQTNLEELEAIFSVIDIFYLSPLLGYDIKFGFIAMIVLFFIIFGCLFLPGNKKKN